MRRAVALCAVLGCAVGAAVVAAAGKGDNEAIIRKYLRVWNTGDMTLADSVLAANVTRAGPQSRFSAQGINNLKEYIAEARNVYSDFKVTVDDLVESGDRVVLSWTVRATHSGAENPEAAGKRVKASGTSFYRIARNKIVEERVSWDFLGVYDQLGIDPPEDTTRHNINLARKLTKEIYEKGNMDAAYEIIDEDHIFHVPAGADYKSGREGVTRRAVMFRTAFPDLKFNIDQTFAEGDLVAMHWTFRGTHNGQFLGAAPTGKQVNIEGLSMSRIKDGKIVESWGFWDTGQFFQQVGIDRP